jgi:hypothetical protein
MHIEQAIIDITGNNRYWDYCIRSNIFAIDNSAQTE